MGRRMSGRGVLGLIVIAVVVVLCVLFIWWHKSSNPDVGLFIALRDRGLPDAVAISLACKYEPLALELRREGQSFKALAGRILQEETQGAARHSYAKEQVATEYVVDLLRPQMRALEDDEGRLPTEARDPWSIGYVYGVSRLAAKRFGLDDEQEQRLVAFPVFEQVFGAGAMPPVNAKPRDDALHRGMAAGEADLDQAQSQQGGAASSWTDYVLAA